MASFAKDIDFPPASNQTLAGTRTPTSTHRIAMFAPRLILRLATRLTICSLALSPLAGCTGSSGQAPTLSQADARAIGDSIQAIVRGAYDLSKGDVPTRMLSVYPESGRVVSATAGRVTNTRALLETSVHAFWDGVGQYMIKPSWTWTNLEVEAIDRNTAMMTAQYSVPHWTDVGAPHVIGGVWTALWRRRGGRWEITHEHLSDMPRASAQAMEATMSPIAPTPRGDSAAGH